MSASAQWGYSCWQPDCRNSFNVPIGRMNEAEDLAGMAGWVIGHWDGQGHYACPDHRDTLWEPISLADRYLARRIAHSVTEFARAA